MIRRCDDCGAEVRDTIGSRQCALFAPADPRIDPCAAESLKAGRILCPACARGVPLEPLDTPEAVALELADGEADAADDGPGPIGSLLVPLSRLAADLVHDMIDPFDSTKRGGPWSGAVVSWVEPIGEPGSIRYRDRLALARRCVEAVGGRLVNGEDHKGPGGWQGRHVYQGDPEAPEDRVRRVGPGR